MFKFKFKTSNHKKTGSSLRPVQSVVIMDCFTQIEARHAVFLADSWSSDETYTTGHK